MNLNRRVFLTGAAAAASACAGGHVPRDRTRDGRIAVSETTLVHSDGRETRYRLMIARGVGPCPVVLFSHGANSVNTAYDDVWGPWAMAGYAVIGANHIDSGPPSLQRHVGDAVLWRTRVADTTLPLRHRDAFDKLAAGHGTRLDWHSLGAAGHSYGAVVAQRLAGATLIDRGEGLPYAAPTPRIEACVVLSPPGPLKNFIPEDAWKSVRVPCLLQTGDRDILPGFVDDWHSRSIGYAGGRARWMIMAHGVNHVFGGLICQVSPGPEATAARPALLETAELSTDFLDAYLRRRRAAASRLQRRAALGDDGVLSFTAA